MPDKSVSMSQYGIILQICKLSQLGERGRAHRGLSVLFCGSVREWITSSIKNFTHTTNYTKTQLHTIL